eukprot:6476479-Amphidinium_carterae.1
MQICYGWSIDSEPNEGGTTAHRTCRKVSSDVDQIITNSGSKKCNKTMMTWKVHGRCMFAQNSGT